MNTITKQLLDKLFVIDIFSGKMYWKNVSKFHNSLNGKEAGCCQKTTGNKAYWVIKINNKKYKRGRLIFFYVNNFFPTPCVDHIDGNSLNDAITNLRQASVTENSWNHKGRKKKSNLPMGIRASGNKFIARIAFNKKTIYLGTFNNLEEAKQTYKQKRIELYGKYSGY